MSPFKMHIDERNNYSIALVNINILTQLSNRGFIYRILHIGKSKEYIHKICTHKYFKILTRLLSIFPESFKADPALGLLNNKKKLRMNACGCMCEHAFIHTHMHV